MMEVDDGLIVETQSHQVYVPREVMRGTERELRAFLLCSWTIAERLVELYPDAPAEEVMMVACAATHRDVATVLAELAMTVAAAEAGPWVWSELGFDNREDFLATSTRVSMMLVSTARFVAETAAEALAELSAKGISELNEAFGLDDDGLRALRLTFAAMSSTTRGN